MRQSLNGTEEHLRDGWLADPAKSQAGERDSKLDRRQEVVQMLLQALDGTGAGASGVDQLLNACVTNADDRKLGRHKKRIQGHQQHDNQNAKEHQGRHWWLV